WGERLSNLRRRKIHRHVLEPLPQSDEYVPLIYTWPYQQGCPLVEPGLPLYRQKPRLPKHHVERLVSYFASPLRDFMPQCSPITFQSIVGGLTLQQNIQNILKRARFSAGVRQQAAAEGP